LSTLGKTKKKSVGLLVGNNLQNAESEGPTGGNLGLKKKKVLVRKLPCASTTELCGGGWLKAMPIC